MSIKFRKIFWPIVLSIILVVFAVFVADWLRLYDQIRNLDKLFHLLGGMLAGWIFALCVDADQTVFKKTHTIAIITAGACLIGVSWEFAEYLSKTYGVGHFRFLYDYFRIGSLTDTLGDLTADISGGLIFALLYVWRKTPSPRNSN